jgi:hypothetical protein
MDEKERLREHLRILSILHYVAAALSLLGVCFGGFYVGMGGLIAKGMEEQQRTGRGAPPPPFVEMFGGMFAAFGLVIVLVSLAAAVCYALSGYWLSEHRNRTFSMVVAGFACLSVPLGTLLGVFTLIALTKPAAEELYAEAERGG